MAEPSDAFKGRLIDREVQPGGERDGPKHSDRILEKPRLRIANRSHQAGTEIVEPADVIDDRKRSDVVEQGIDREVAAEGVFLGRAKRVVAMEKVRIAAGRFSRLVIRRRNAILDDLFARLHLPAKRRDLDHFESELHMREPKPPTDDPAVPKQFLDLIRMGRRADVEILGATAEQQVPDASANEIGDVIALS